MPVVDNVLIVGGGIAGLTLAIGLNRAGIATEVIEINPESTVTGLGLSLPGPALRALKMIALLDQCVERGFGYSYNDHVRASGDKHHSFFIFCLSRCFQRRACATRV